jgi:hypothetical protein
MEVFYYENLVSFERIPILESSRKRGLPPDLCTNKGKPALVRSALRSGPGFENRRFSFYNLAEPFDNRLRAVSLPNPPEHT